jgi:hypothetical protein
MPVRTRHRLFAVLATCSAALLLSACAPTVALTPAADADDPGCADIIVHLPDEVAGKQQRETNAQATGAWGDPVVVTLTCGVTPIGPTTKPCITVSGIDWVLENNPADETLKYITFGRVPATEVDIAHGTGGVPDYDVLPDLASAVSQVPQLKQSKCIGINDVPGTGTSTAAPSPAATPTP